LKTPVAKRAALWGGRFSEPPAAVLSRLNDSFAFDRALLPQDVAGSIAWAEALRRAKVLSRAEAARLVRGLRAIGRKGVAGIPPGASDEDVHSYVEGTLRRRLGPLAGKLHTGRSRNDQVATDLRLWLRDALDEGRDLVLGLAASLAARARAEAGSPMPGYTHLKRAEPVTFGHWCLAYVEMLLRDADRLAAARRRGNECPLGSGALSGTPVPVDREALARRLGFDRPTANSLDGVSDRDTAAEYLFAASLLLVHLSRLGEDLIFFSSDEAGFVALPDALATGSSRMPQKKNPDLLELARGHAGRAIGELAGLLAVLKGLPLAYDKDLQLDKEPAFRVRAVVAAVLPALTQLVARLKLDRRAMKRAAADDRLLATELADALAKRGIPFREAHDIVGRRIARAEAEGTSLAAAGPADGIGARDLAVLDVGRALAKRRAVGGASPRRVAAAARDAARRIAAAARSAARRTVAARRRGGP
jgi:argininosuccinate lyase